MDELVGVTKMLCALVEHSSEWLVTRISQPDVQAFFGTVLRFTGWSGTAGVDEEVSEVSSSASELT
jgi:hypothetical protein